MTDDLIVRVGVPADVDEVMSLALAACEENAAVPWSTIKLLENVWAALNRNHGIMGVIGPPEGPLEGALLIRTGTLWYSDVEIAEEKALFIHPRFRQASGGRAARLCEFAKQVASSLGMPLVIGVLSNHRTEAKMRLYSRQFGKPTGTFFIYNGVNHAEQ